MGGIFGSKPKPYEPTEAQKELEAQQLETSREQKSEIASRAARATMGKTGRRSLLTGAATGTEEKKTTLG